MDCQEARTLIDPYLDGELGAERSAALEQHAASCRGCAAAIARRRALSAALKEKLIYHAAPPALMAALGEASGRPRAVGVVHRAPPPWMRMAAAFLLVAGLSSLLTYYVTPGDQALVPDEVFADHLRGLRSESSLIDVVSSDRHTVKPWFAGKLDFSPPVVDLASDGFALAGARVDYIGGRPVAALVFRHLKHVITLFIWPSSGRAGDVVSQAHQGENLVHWQDGSMTYWAISDMDPRDLHEFAARYRKASPGGPEMPGVKAP
jgi:anti-sigma factor RsiW